MNLIYPLQGLAVDDGWIQVNLGNQRGFFFVKIDFLAGQGYKPLRLYLNYRLHLFTWSGDIPFVYNGAQSTLFIYI